MTNYDFASYEEKLNRQVIHMDQGLAYCPEFRVTRRMTDYPSRKMQIARAVHKKELIPTQFTADILNSSLLSRQGERWQNFGEDPEDYTDCLILARQMLLEQGLNGSMVDQLTHRVKENNGHLFSVLPERDKTWTGWIPVDANSDRYIMLDDASYFLVADQARNIGTFLKKIDYKCMPEIRACFLGWEYFAYGMVDQGIKYAKETIEELTKKGVKELLVLSGQADYLWRNYLPKIGLHHDFKITNLLELVKEIDIPESSFVYAGSFYTRYLMASEKLNEIMANKCTEVLKCSEEFSKSFSSGKRINEINIWQKPLCAEFFPLGLGQDLQEKIFNDSFADIERTPHKQLIIFEPYAYSALKNKKKDEKTMYFTEYIK